MRQAGPLGDGLQVVFELVVVLLAVPVQVLGGLERGERLLR
ncbi:hypothetical protein ACOZ38_27725 [Sphaerisporangium viridialbum]